MLTQLNRRKPNLVVLHNPNELFLNQQKEIAMTDEKELLKSILPTKVVEKAYEDMLSSSAQEVGKLARDIVKTGRLLLAPIQLAATFQDRFERMLLRIAMRVPENRRMPAPAEVVGPALDQMKYLEEDNPLWQMFEEVLTRSMDEILVQTIHPAFPHLISHLSRDEAWILYRLNKSNFEVVDVMELNRQENRFVNRRIEESNLPNNELFFPDNLELYYSHLESLSLVSWPVYKQDPLLDPTGQQTGIRRYSRMHLTDFGRLFVNSCIPEHGFLENNS